MPISMVTVMALMTLCGTVLGITLLGMAGILTVMAGILTVMGGMAMATVGDTPVILPPSVITMVGMPIT